jgi:hypothetical protein
MRGSMALLTRSDEGQIRPSGVQRRGRWMGATVCAMCDGRGSRNWCVPIEGDRFLV